MGQEATYDVMTDKALFNSCELNMSTAIIECNYICMFSGSDQKNKEQFSAIQYCKKHKIHLDNKKNLQNNEGTVC